MNARGTSVSSIAASTVLRQSLREISSSPRSSRWAFMTMRRYLVMVTPGMATGYWKAMNRPMRARSSGDAPVMSWPLKWIVPSVTSRLGCPMITLARVDLPEPLGPMSACTSPLLTERSRPLRICFSPAWTWRLRISRSAMCGFVRPWCLVGSGGDVRRGRSAGALGEGHELGERRVGQGVHDAAVHAQPQQLRAARAALVLQVRAEHAARLLTGGVVDEAAHRGHGALQGDDGLVHRDLRRLARQAVAAVRAARALDQVGLLQQRDDPLEVGEGQALGRGDRLQRHGLVAAVAAELDEQPHPVLSLRREDHDPNPTNGVGDLPGRAHRVRRPALVPLPDRSRRVPPPVKRTTELHDAPPSRATDRDARRRVSA